MTRALWLLGILVAALYGALLWFGVIRLGVLDGAPWPPDTRLAGYDVPGVEAWLDAVSRIDGALASYLGPARWLDTLFPPLLALFMVGLLWVNGRPWLAFVPVLYAATDLWENARISAAVIADDATALAAVSSVTQGKFALLVLSLGLIWIAWRGRRQASA